MASHTRFLPIALAVALVACTPAGRPAGSGTLTPTPPPTATPTTSPGASSSAGRSPSASPSAPVSPTASPSPFACQALPYARTSAALEVPIVDVRVGAHPDYDRVVFDFGATAPLPDIRVERTQPPFALDPSGLPATVAGSAFLHVRLSGVMVDTVSPSQIDQKAGYPVLVELRRLGSFEGVSLWVAGLSGANCVRILTLSGPTRLVIDVAKLP